MCFLILLLLTIPNATPSTPYFLILKLIFSKKKIVAMIISKFGQIGLYFIFSQKWPKTLKRQQEDLF